MNLAKIVLTRIDARLVHGQVGATWANSFDVDTLVVIDEETVQNPLSRKLMESVALAADKNIRFYSVDDFAKIYPKVSSNQQLFLVVSSPETVKRLVQNNIPIDVVNVGNMHYQKGKVPLTRKMYLNDEDIDALNYLLSKDINVYYQDVPGSFVEKITFIDKDKLKQRTRRTKL